MKNGVRNFEREKAVWCRPVTMTMGNDRDALSTVGSIGQGM
jgi:hypothetical protein